MAGVILIVTYAPNNTILTPDPAGGVWGDVLGVFIDPANPGNSGWMEAIFDSGFWAFSPQSPPIFSAVDFTNDQEIGPVIRISLKYDVYFQDTNLESALSSLSTESEKPATVALLAPFDSVSSMSYVNTSIEQWSDEESP